MEKIISEKNIKKIVFILMLLAIFVYEWMYCNASLFTGENKTYQFSPFRFFIYILIMIVMYHINKNSLEEVTKSFQIPLKKRIMKVIGMFGIIVLIELCVLKIINPDFIEIKKLSIYILTILISFLLGIYVTKDYSKNILVTIIGFGIVFSIGINFNNIIDEKRHFLAAYNIQMGNLDYNEPIMNQKLQDMEKEITASDFNQYFNESYEDIYYEQKEEDITNMPATYSHLLYLPSAIAIFIARLFHASIADMYIIGRIANVFVYAILMFLAIKIIPYKKKTLYVIGIMPTLVALSSVYSVDGITMGVISIFISYCLKLYEQKEEINTKQILKLMLIWFFVLQLKSMAYIFVSIILFILPIRKILQQNRGKIKFFAIGIILILIINIIYTINIGVRKDLTEGDSRVENTSVMGQIEYMIQNPVQYISLMLRSTFNYFTNYNILYRIHERVFFTNENVYKVFLFLFLYLFYISLTDTSKNLDKKVKVIFISTFFIQIFVILTTLYIDYTGVGAQVIQGYQPRYLYPLLFLVSSIISSNKINYRDENEEIKVTFIMYIFILISIIGMISLV